ncbi:hypothetical protein ANCCEY_10674 [Ancylostoma ceylanicum]|uniref:Uncharacterized protein n=1 Tax=Ancylostoma ceylanicum TaxID=53326 RepID=A0A0D6LGB8_9BILA|nr:hypothetical protein ANCCEY_10674 [Ancylostoma ceylanicum]
MSHAKDIHKGTANLIKILNEAVLIWTLITANIVHSIFVGGIQVRQLMKMLTVTDPCDILMSAVVISSTGLSAYCMKNYDFTARTFYCTAATKSTMYDVSTTSYFIVVVEAIIILLFGYVYYLNLRKSVIYDLRSKYQAIENLTVLRLLMPMIIPIYTACAPLLMGWILRQHRLSRNQALIRISSEKKNDNDIYFSNYAWNTK